MSTHSSSLTNTAVAGVRSALAFTGAISLLVGLLILVWPEHSALAVTWVLAIYAVIVGFGYLAAGAVANGLGGSRRVTHIVLGLVFIAVAIVAFANVAAAAAWLITFFGLFVGIAWVVEGIVAMTLVGTEEFRSWTVLFSMVSIIAGIFLIVSPAWGGLLLWGLFGMSLIVLGILQLIRAARFRVE